MKSWLWGCPRTAFMQKRRPGGKSSANSFCPSQEGKTGSEPVGTKEEKGIRGLWDTKNYFCTFCILQPKFSYSQTFTWGSTQSYNNVLRMSSPDAKAQLVEEAAGCWPRQLSDGLSQFCLNPSQITARPILELWGFGRASFLDQEMHQVYEKWEHPIQANFSLSPYLDEKSQLFIPRLSWQSPKIHGVQRERRFEAIKFLLHSLLLCIVVLIARRALQQYVWNRSLPLTFNA